MDKLVQQLEHAWSKHDVATVKMTVDSIKLAIAQGVATSGKDLEMSRRAFEVAAFACVFDKDIDGFLRAFVQLKVYYFEHRSVLPPSQDMCQLHGLHLLALLAANRLADFHTELELIPFALRSNEFVKYAINMEQELMEGSYSQLWDAAKHAPESYKYLVGVLLNTVRNRILDCCEKSYTTLSVRDVVELLNLSSIGEAKKFIEDRGKWTILANDTIVFNNEVADNLHIPAHDIVDQVLGYATELERII